jgi:putative hydrolase of the HAD superfamily
MAVEPIREVEAVLLDAMGTLLRLVPPAPLLREALWARLGADVGEDAARRAMRAEIRHYRAHLHTGRDAPSLAALRRESAEAMRAALGPVAAEAPGELLTDALLAALRFEAYPDAPGVLRTLRAAGVRLVVVSNWDVSLGERLDETGLGGLVDGWVASAPFGAAKPDASIFAHALGIAGAPAARAWHVGDDPEADVAGALGAGLRAVLVARDGAPAERDAAVPVVSSLAPLPEILGIRPGAEYPQCRR